jgi:hypothetical protein
MSEPRPVYEHRQTAMFMRVSFALAVAVLLALYAAQPAEQHALLVVAPLFLLVFVAFDGLTIRIAGGELRWAFGVFGFPRGRLALADIAAATATRTTFWEGWGIRYTRRGWLFNLNFSPQRHRGHRELRQNKHLRLRNTISRRVRHERPAKVCLSRCSLCLCGSTAVFSFNVSGFDAVLIRRTGGKTFLLGTDEPRKLVAAIESAKRNL